MRPELLYLIGQPGAGKSTVCDWLTESLEFEQLEQPFAHRIWTGRTGEPVVELGARREKFSGTDALSMSVQPKVLDWLYETEPPLVLGEGDRLGNDKFFQAVTELGYKLTVIHLAVSAGVAARRRAARQLELGTGPQNEAWVRGRATKAARLAAGWSTAVIEADQPMRLVCQQVRGFADDCRVLAALAYRAPR